MLADSGVFANSPWHSEALKDVGTYFHNASLDLSLQGMDLDLATLETEIKRVQNHQQNLDEFSPLTEDLDSCGTSVASSVCSEELCLDNEGSLGDLLFSSNSEYLSTSLQSLLELGDVTSSLEWSDSGLLSAGTSGDCHLDSPLSSPVKHTSTSPRHNANGPVGKRWSELSVECRVEVVEEISRVISNELGLREQLEVIRLINPAADVSPTDKEFVIDLETITEEKLKQIQDFIKAHVESSSDLTQEGQSPQKKHCKKPTKERRSQHKAVRQRQRKEYRQMMKERRSGLFVKEQVLALSVCEPIEEDDVDILA